MKKKHKKVILAIFGGCAGIVVVTVLLTVFWTAFALRRLFEPVPNPTTRADRASAISLTREWARLAPFPETAKNLSIVVTGNIFTRGFKVSFRAPSADVQAWLAQSPGTKDLEPTMRPDGSRHYKIQPGGGAQFAELVVSPDGTEVRIRTFWS